MTQYEQAESGQIPVISLSQAPGEQLAWDKPKAIIYAWAAVELLLVTNSWQISSRIRVAALRAFGATIGSGVIFRPGTRVKFPWKLHVGDNSWIGERVWIHNQDYVYIGHDVVVSQETFITTGSHAHRSDMRLLTKPIHISDGAWVTSRCVVLGGSMIGRSAVVAPMITVSGVVPPNTVVSSGKAIHTARRFESDCAS